MLNVEMAVAVATAEFAATHLLDYASLYCIDTMFDDDSSVNSINSEWSYEQASLIWGFPILPILSSYGKKKIKYGLNMVFH